MTDLTKLPHSLVKKLKKTFGSVEKFYATVYLIARNEHACQTLNVAGAEQKLKTIHAYQGIIRFMLDEEGIDGKDLINSISSDYLEDFVNYKEKDFGMTNEEFVNIIKQIR